MEALARSRWSADPQLLKRRVSDLREQNPMLGHRGVRLLLSYPEIVDMQARAVFEAVADVQHSHWNATDSGNHGAAGCFAHGA